jgi:hypothetical protein
MQQGSRFLRLQYLFLKRRAERRIFETDIDFALRFEESVGVFVVPIPRIRRS